MSARDRILAALAADPKLTARDLAERLEISKQRVHQILRDAGMKAAPSIRGRRPITTARHAEGRMNGLGSLGRLAPSFVGAAQELVVCVDLMRRGAHVYRAMSHASPADLIAAIGDRLLRIEVRSGRRNTEGRLSYSQPQAGRYDVLAVVEPDGAVTYKPEWPA
ncbi:hypothetical protein ASF36_13990 [Methylobacterium sp. Leaf90]|nr:hypothetical protein ASF36_13990 [Methylobacterium sp. Leaf90]